MNTMKQISIACISVVCILAFLFMPASAHQDAVEDEIAEIIEHADDLFDLAEVIHDESQAIYRDETVSEEIRDLAHLVHMAAHELEHIAEHLQEDAAELEILGAEPIANRAAINLILADMREEIAEYTELLDSQHDNIHELEYNVLESHIQHADAIHDAAHKAERDARHLLRHIDALEAALDDAASPQAPSAPAESPGFSALAALAGIMAVVYAIRRQ
ncbi:MAG: hypothetical protein D5R99_07975 [Methanocalculus sp. MSAO_Arc1]|uniref:PGF-CTERM sorting domain-containing protein n=1 Tax=Methanocalculus TaxID=71151 RepID=UPI000FF835BC|nr:MULTISPECIES: PGF-CTERM sorting domain-containing protein [unclassified Methanocalculus]MCP1662406.1 PGF-CTERM protein [Methanocalculus sp. AMF5]RQD79471.1 MAG: hypothetical protein D5R99_07975 [Methanocalculus sp. MSAO_Arc1]